MLCFKLVPYFVKQGVIMYMCACTACQMSTSTIIGKQWVLFFQRTKYYEHETKQN